MELTAKLQVRRAGGGEGWRRTRRRQRPKSYAHIHACARTHIHTHHFVSACIPSAQAGDSERRRLDSMLDAARQECNNLQARLSQLQRDHQRVQESSRPTSARSLKPVPVVLSTPPRASASISALAHSLREAEAAIALRDKELAAARARLSEQPAGEMRAFRVPDVPKLQPRPPNASVPPPGIVARLQADLQEAAEERRIARQQAQALRERVRELERLLGGAGGGGDPSDDRMAQELQDTRVRLTAAEARAQELDKRMQMSLNRQKEQAQQIAALKQRLQDAADQASLSESDRADAAVLSGQLRALQVTLNAERTSSQQLSERLRRAEEAERAMADKLREAKEAAARASAQARSERADLEAKNREELLRLREDGRAALAGETALREQSEADLAALRRRLAEMQADNSEITKMRDREAEGRGLYEREAAEMRARLDRQDADLATKDARLREREKSKNELAAALERNATRLREAEGELEGLRHQLSQSEAISGGRIELEAELAGLRQRLSEFESNVGKLNEALDRSEAERARLEEEVSRHSEARKVTDELRRKLDHAVAEASTLRDKATIDYAKAQDMERQLRIVEGRESALETDRRELQRQVDALSQELRMASGDAKEAQKFEKMLQVTEKARAELEKELANARAMVCATSCFHIAVGRNRGASQRLRTWGRIRWAGKGVGCYPRCRGAAMWI